MVEIQNIQDILKEECILKGMERIVKMHKIEWCEGGLQLAEIGTKNVSEPDLKSRMKYIMVRLEN